MSLSQSFETSWLNAVLTEGVSGGNRTYGYGRTDGGDSSVANRLGGSTANWTLTRGGGCWLALLTRRVVKIVAVTVPCDVLAGCCAD
ncbi:hypothetical protein [Rhodopirellula bahusiensis]|uniref:Uncharacterized protein n=1 Tax=Rhodopirellula bahusiensis TaxID=2014065 RepID=A0A2G1W2U0_9BACT|nr:hypothetical protein [Rhodopirellula bahusiensis]PHQ33180.1 hypothetical protein CEE69_22230 [Rhodopirellula bahusiensis]